MYLFRARAHGLQFWLWNWGLLAVAPTLQPSNSGPRVLDSPALNLKRQTNGSQGNLQNLEQPPNHPRISTQKRSFNNKHTHTQRHREFNKCRAPTTELELILQVKTIQPRLEYAGTPSLLRLFPSPGNDRSSWASSHSSCRFARIGDRVPFSTVHAFLCFSAGCADESLLHGELSRLRQVAPW